MSVLSFFPGYFTIVFFFGEALYNITLMSSKMVMQRLKVDFDTEMYIVWAHFVVSAVGFGITFALMTAYDPTMQRIWKKSEI